MNDASPQQYLVVANDEEQYSLWETGQPVPLGWHDQDVRGTKEECLAHIERVWTDMRPLSLRVSMAG
ncbi:MbtH family protein [Streptomyces virginiae]|uniref:MbtH family protein n=1 Tax=Streptomyces virginiae TaxID=1961 RepID=UPI003713DD5A